MKKKATIKMKGMRIMLPSRAQQALSPIYYLPISRELYQDVSNPNIFCPAEVPRISPDSPEHKRWDRMMSLQPEMSYLLLEPDLKLTSTNMMRFLRPKSLN